MEKVIIVNPDAKMDAKQFAYAPLGILYLAAVLERDGFECELWDLREDYNSYDNPPEGDIYCITAVTPQIDDMKEVARNIKKKYGDKAYTIIGGPHATWLPEDCLDHFDCVVQDEAESIITKICTEKPTGLQRGERIENLDKIPHPARHLLPDHRAASTDLWGGYNYESNVIGATLMSSRGCPFACAFCANLQQKTRFRSAENIVEEIVHMKEKYGVRNFRFLDDNIIIETLFAMPTARQALLLTHEVLGFRLSPTKAVPARTGTDGIPLAWDCVGTGTPRAISLGVEWDWWLTEAERLLGVIAKVRLPSVKAAKYYKRVYAILRANKMSSSEARKIASTFEYVCSVAYGKRGRAFLWNESFQEQLVVLAREEGLLGARPEGYDDTPLAPKCVKPKPAAALAALARL